MDIKWDRDRDDDVDDEETDEETEDDELDAEVDQDDEDDEDDEDEDEDAVEVRQEFADVQQLAHPGSEQLRKRLSDPGTTPKLSADDLDADWERADPVGEETVGGTVSTPDQDIVDDIGEAVGVTYSDNEPIDPDKVDRRDTREWDQIDPRTEADYPERQEDLDSAVREAKQKERKSKNTKPK